MRDIAVLLVVFGSLLVIPFRPYYGLLVFSWLAYMRAPDLAWSLQGLRMSLWVAIATLVGVVIAVLQRRERFAAFRPQTILMIALLGWIALSEQQAMNHFLAHRELVLFSKVVLVALVTTGLVQSQHRFRWLMIVIALSLGLLGLKYGLWGVLRGGARIAGGPGGFMKDNNGFALALNMGIPLLVGVALTERQRWFKVFCGVLVLFTMLSVFFTFSRGGLLTLVVIGAGLVLRTGRPVLAILLLVLGVGGFAALSSSETISNYMARAETIGEYDEDRSAMGRIEAWKTAIRVAKRNPVFGVGPDNLMVVYLDYSDTEERRVAHNAFLQLLAETGVPAASMWVFLILVTLIRLEMLSRSNPDTNLAIYARTLQLSIVAYVTGGMFLDKAYFDLFYHLAAMSVSLELVAAAEVPQPQAQASRAAVPWWKEPREATG